jgi:hypothetical protein
MTIVISAIYMRRDQMTIVIGATYMRRDQMTIVIGATSVPIKLNIKKLLFRFLNNKTN